MDSTTIKLEAGTSAEESVAVMMTEIDIQLENSFVKEECMEFICENISGELETTDHSNLEGVTIKVESETKKEEIAVSYTEIDIEVPDIKKESLENSDRIHQTEGAAFRLKKIYSVQQKCDGKECNNSTSFPCSECDRKFASKPGLIAPLLTRSKTTPMSCSYCNYSCSIKGNFTRHMRIHTKEKPFSCSFCSFACSQKSRIALHERTHTKETPFSCFNCNYSCSDKSNLIKHMRSHTNEKPFSCSYCNYSCSNKSNLTVHERTHTKEKPFSCSYCSYSSSQSSKLTRHLHSCKEKAF